MNKLLTIYATLVLCIAHTGAFGYGENLQKRPSRMRKALTTKQLYIKAGMPLAAAGGLYYLHNNFPAADRFAAQNWKNNGFTHAASQWGMIGCAGMTIAPFVAQYYSPEIGDQISTLGKSAVTLGGTGAAIFYTGNRLSQVLTSAEYKNTGAFVGNSISELMVSVAAWYYAVNPATEKISDWVNDKLGLSQEDQDPNL